MCDRVIRKRQTLYCARRVEQQRNKVQRKTNQKCSRNGAKKQLAATNREQDGEESGTVYSPLDRQKLLIERIHLKDGLYTIYSSRKKVGKACQLEL
jgi:hypothetical protein